jgi:hypothetical protein
MGPFTHELRGGSFRVPSRSHDRAQPVACRHEGVLFADHWTAHADALEGGVEEDVDQRLAGGRDVGGVERVAQFGAGARPVLERPRDDLDPTVGPVPHPGLPQPRLARRPERRRGQRLQQRIVLGPDQVQGPAVDPGDDQPPLIQSPIDIRGRQPFTASPHRKSSPPPILPLDRKQSLSDCDWIPRRTRRQPLRSKASPVYLGPCHRLEGRPDGPPERTSPQFVREGVHQVSLPTNLSLCRRAGSRCGARSSAPAHPRRHPATPRSSPGSCSARRVAPPRQRRS